MVNIKQADLNDVSDASNQVLSFVFMAISLTIANTVVLYSEDMPLKIVIKNYIKSC